MVARRNLLAALTLTEFRLPDEPFQGRIRFPGARGVFAVESGAHSESDAVLWVHDAEVLFVGDLLTIHTHPNLQTGSLPSLRNTLSKLEEMRPKVVVPGHGPVGDPRSFGEFRKYLDTLEELAAQAAAPLLPSEYAEWRSPSLFESNIRFLRAGGGVSRPG